MYRTSFNKLDRTGPEPQTVATVYTITRYHTHTLDDNAKEAN